MQRKFQRFMEVDEAYIAAPNDVRILLTAHDIIAEICFSKRVVIRYQILSMENASPRICLSSIIYMPHYRYYLYCFFFVNLGNGCSSFQQHENADIYTGE